jgi:putative oxidoreductase
LSLTSSIEQKLTRPDWSILVLRLVFGALLVVFGVQKLLGGGTMFEMLGKSLEMFGITWEPKLWGLLCALAETFGGLFIVLGLLFRPAAFILIINMVVATVVNFKMSGAPDYSSMDAFCKWLGTAAIPAYFLAVFIALLFTGAGKYAMQKSGGSGRGGSGKAKD